MAFRKNSGSSDEAASEFEKRRRAFENQPSNIQLLTSPGKAYGSTSRASNERRPANGQIPPPRHEMSTSSSNLAIGEETGQKEQVFQPPAQQARAPSTRIVSPPPVNEYREEPVLSQQIATLRLQNEQLQQQLRDRENEKERLSQQLDDRNSRVNYSPIGLPSRVLDGRKVLKDSHSLSTTPPPPPHTPTSPLSPRPMSGSPIPYDVRGDVYTELKLRRINRNLEQRLLEIAEENSRLELELQRQKDNLEKVQEREQDLTEDIQTLRTENSHHVGAISKLKTERDSLKASNGVFRSDLSSLSTTLTKTEKCYKEVEQENLSLQEDIKQLLVDKDQLSTELRKLQSTVEDDLKTKENYRSTIRQLREQNLSLEGQLSSTEQQSAQVKDRVSPAPKAQNVLGEVLTLRQERSTLKSRLKSAQHEIDSLEASLKDQESVDRKGEGLETELRESITSHLQELSQQVISLSEEVQLTRDTVAMTTQQHQILMREKFLSLVVKCQAEIKSALDGKTEVSQALSNAEISLAGLQRDIEKLQVENKRLQSQKTQVSSDVSKLRTEIQELQDQKKLLEVQLAQSNTLAQEKDEEISILHAENVKLEDRIKSSEKKLNSKINRLESEWEGRVAMATQAHELLVDSKEELELKIEELESKLADLELQNKKMAAIHSSLEEKQATLQTKLTSLSSECVLKDQSIEKAQTQLARLLTAKAILRAKSVISNEQLQVKLAKVKSRNSIELDTMKSERDVFEFSLVQLEDEKSSVQVEIERLSSSVSGLVNEKAELQSQVTSLAEKHFQAQQEVQQLVDNSQRRQLESEKVKMTLLTELQLLKSRFKTSSDSEHSASAFQPVSGPQNHTPSHTSQGWQVEQLLKQITTLKQENIEKKRVSTNESITSRLALAELQAQLSALEEENKKLKQEASEVARISQSAEMTTLRKQVSELGRKGFYLESERKQLTERLKITQGNLKLVREMKERPGNERQIKLQEENQALLDKVHSLENSLTKTTMTNDLRVIQTVKDNEKLREKLIKVVSLLEAERSHQSELKKLISLFKDQYAAVNSLLSMLSEVKTRLQSMQGSDWTLRACQSVETGSGRSVKVIRKTTSNHNGSVSMATGRGSPLTMGTKQDQLRERNDEINKILAREAEVVQALDAKLVTIATGFSCVGGKLEACLASSHSLCEQLSSARESEPRQLRTERVLEQQVESLQDQVIDRESALQDIELQMRKDYSEQDKKFTSLKSQLIQLREQLTHKDQFLRTKDQYILQLEEKQVAIENQLYQAHKDMERHKSDKGGTNLNELVHVQTQEIHELRKIVDEFSFEIQGLQGQLDAVHRERSMLRAKAVDSERIHTQIKDSATAEINYLRRVILEFVEQQLKGERAGDVLKEVTKAKDNFRKQRDHSQLEKEMDSQKIIILEQSRIISELETQLANQNISLKLLQAEKDHAFLLNQHAKDLSNQISARAGGVAYHRPHSAGTQMPQFYRTYSSGDNKTLQLAPGASLQMQGEFAIPFPVGQGVGILNLEEGPQSKPSQFQLGPTVFTDDESPQLTEHGKTRSLRPTKSRVRVSHRRTASTGSDVIPPIKEQTTPGGGVAPSSLIGKLKGYEGFPRRPGSADSTRQLSVDLNDTSSIRGRATSVGGVPLVKSSLAQQNLVSNHKPISKSTDSTETTSSEGKESSNEIAARGKEAIQETDEGLTAVEIKTPAAQFLDRHDSCSSGSSFSRSLLPSRTPSFYDPGSESSPYDIRTSLEDLGFENFSFGGYGNYDCLLHPIHIPKYEPTSSSDDDYPILHTTRLRKKTAESAQHKGPSDNSNSSCDSDKASNQIPLHRNESISISEMENYSTDVEASEKKITELKKNLGRKRYSSTGSVKICYSESSNTSLEDISHH